MAARSIGYFGEPGSFAHQAARERFPKAALQPCASVAEAVAQLKKGAFAQIIVPIENATLGLICDTADELIRLARGKTRARFAVREMLALPVHLALLARKGTRTVERIYSHPAALAHCRAWIARHYPRAQIIASASTSEAAQAALGQERTAAVAGMQAAREYGLSVLHRSLASDRPNQTLFYVVGRPLANSPKPTHASFVYEVKHKPGALVATLAPLAAHGVNLTRIASRPIPGQFDHYWFLLEVCGTPGEEKMRRALREIKAHTTWLELLGAYPMIHLGKKTTTSTGRAQ